MKLTIAIPTYRRHEPLLLTLCQLFAVRRPDEEILVIDQNMDLPDRIEQDLMGWEECGAIRRIRSDHASLTAARNLALQEANAAVVLFLDDDLFIPRETIDRHLQAYQQFEGCAAVTGQVYQCKSAMVCPPEWGSLIACSEKHFIADQARITDTVIGCNHSVLRSAVIAIGGYDEAFIAAAHGEDFDIGHRLTLTGYKVYYDPESWLVHFKVAIGGCRVVRPWDTMEWTNSANLFLYAFRHGKRKRNFWKYFYLALRAGPFRKAVVKRIWLWPWAWAQCLKGMVYGYRHRTFKATIRE